MNNFSKVAVVTAALALVSQAARASNNEDLILGFSDTSASFDYVLDLGQPGVVGVGSGSTVDLSSDISASTFNADFSSLSGVTAGVVGGSSLSTGLAYMTVTRTGALDPSNPGSQNPLNTSIANGGTMSSSTAKLIGSHAEGVTLGSPSNTDPASWTQNVINYAGTQATFSPQTDLSSGTVYEDLYSTRNANDSTWNYLGYFSFNFSNPNSPDVTFTSVPVPEPTICSLLGVGGLLALGRRRFARKAA